MKKAREYLDKLDEGNLKIGDMVYVKNAYRFGFPGGVYWGWVNGYEMEKDATMVPVPGYGMAPTGKVKNVIVSIPDIKEGPFLNWTYLRGVGIPRQHLERIAAGRWSSAKDAKRELRKYLKKKRIPFPVLLER